MGKLKKNFLKNILLIIPIISIIIAVSLDGIDIGWTIVSAIIFAPFILLFILLAKLFSFVASLSKKLVEYPIKNLFGTIFLIFLCRCYQSIFIIFFVVVNGVLIGIGEQGSIGKLVGHQELLRSFKGWDIRVNKMGPKL